MLILQQFLMIPVFINSSALTSPQAVLIDRIEEDWELVVDVPDTISEGPQITMVMLADRDDYRKTFAFNVNYRSHTDYRAGGLEVLAYDDEQVIDSANSKSNLLNTSGERITWTQVMDTSLVELRFGILRGDSQTWSTFGTTSGGALSLSVTSPVSNLNGYDPTRSVEESGVGWQPNRVQSLRLLGVRYYSGGVLVGLDQTIRSVEIDN